MSTFRVGGIYELSDGRRVKVIENKRGYRWARIVNLSLENRRRVHIDKKRLAELITGTYFSPRPRRCRGPSPLTD